MSAVLWNKINYIRRQALFKDRFSWEEGVKELYNEFKQIIGSATAQQIIRKNDFAWKSFFKLKRLQSKNKLSKHIKKVSPPRSLLRNQDFDTNIHIDIMPACCPASWRDKDFSSH